MGVFLGRDHVGTASEKRLSDAIAELPTRMWMFEFSRLVRHRENVTHQ